MEQDPVGTLEEEAVEAAEAEAAIAAGEATTVVPIPQRAKVYAVLLATKYLTMERQELQTKSEQHTRHSHGMWERCTGQRLAMS